MDACQNLAGMIVFSPAAGVMMTGVGTVIGAAITTLFWQVIKGRDNHIKYIQDVNADLTEINRDAVGVAGGAIRRVGAEKREAAGRRGT